MPMPPIFPHEAFMLGYTIGRTQGGRVSFADALRADMGMFVDGSYLESEYIDIDDLADVKFHEFEDVTLGASSEEYGVLYRHVERGGALRTQLNRQPRPIVDSILKEYKDFVALAPEAKLLYELDGGGNVRTEWEGFMRLHYCPAISRTVSIG